MKSNENLCFESEQGRKLIKQLVSCIDEHGMWEKIKCGALLGFSGGADSVFLALALLYLKATRGDFPLYLSHIHHGIRGEGADRDLAFSREFAAAHSLDLFVSHFDIPKLAKEQGIGIEECARNARYSTFEEIIKGRKDVSCILTAHNATDNVETVIQRLMRGGGTHGLCGISPIRDGHILRPILYIAKSDIVSFLNENKILYMVDETNQDNQYTRNFIRNEILPDLARITPSPEVSITRFVQNLREDELCLSDIADTFLNAQGLPYVSLADFLALPRAIQYRVLCKMARAEDGDFMLERIHIDLILSALTSKARERISLTPTLSFVLEKGKMYFYREEKTTQQVFSLSLNTPHYDPYFDATFLYLEESAYQTYKNVYKNSISALISSVIINGELTVRAKKPQDSYRVRKMTRRLKTLIQALHLPGTKADKIPVICDGSGILYVPPFGVREDDAVEESSENRYIMIIYSDGKAMPWRD